VRDNSGRYEDVWAGAESQGERERLLALAEALDGETERRIRALRPQPDWRCLEIGAGAGTVAEWLARTCPEGQVVAADIDPRFLTERENLQVVRHDITVDDFPEKSFDLIHARYVFVHLPSRERLIHEMARWLAPGGWLILEEAARFPVETSMHATYRKVSLAVLDLSQWRLGTDTHWPRGFPEPLRRAGLEDLGFDVTANIVGGGRPLSRFWADTVERFGADLIAGGRATEDEVESVVRLLDDKDFTDLGLATVAAWGQRPWADTEI
jgi:SAM-dependent methyltransferase